MISSSPANPVGVAEQNVEVAVARVPAAAAVALEAHHEEATSGAKEVAAAVACKGAEIAVELHDHTPGYD